MMKRSRRVLLTLSVGSFLAIVAVSVRTQGPQAPPYRPDKPIAIVGGLLIDGTGAAPRWDYTVVMQEDRITQVGPSDSVTPPAGAEVIDAGGMTVMPGLINSNQH